MIKTIILRFHTEISIEHNRKEVFMTYQTVFFRMFVSVILSTLIGLERERNQSTAGLKTHAIVGIAATMIALMQSQIVFETLQRAVDNPGLPEVVRSDPARLIAQVVSGVGFLGAGTIIVTKRNVSGLTTAASIWFVASLGLSIGMGYYTVAVLGFISVMSILLLSKYFLRIPVPRRLVVKYLGDVEVQEEIGEIFNHEGLEAKVIKFDVEMFHEQKIFITTYETNVVDDATFDRLIKSLSKHEQMLSVQLTNI